MRLSADKIKQAILSPDPELRQAALFYFARSHSSDPTLMPLVMQACDRYGLDAFDPYTTLRNLVQTDESARWLIREIERVDPAADERSARFVKGCIATLRRADAALLAAHATAIQEMRRLDFESIAFICDRIDVAALDPDALWQRLIECCEHKGDREGIFPSDDDYSRSLVDALASQPGQCAAQVLEVLKQGVEANGWLEIMAARLAGHLRLEAAIPALLDLLGDVELFAHGDAHQALARIGSDSVLTALSARYATAPDDFRVAAAYLLKDIQSDQSVQTSLKLLDLEQDAEVRGILLQSLLANFATEGVEPARQHVLSTPKCPDVLEVRSDLLVAAKMMETSFAEFEAWIEDAKADVQFRIDWYKNHPLKTSIDEYDDDDYDDDAVGDDSWEDDQDFEGDFEHGGFEGGGFEGGDDFEDHDLRPRETVIRESEKVGRNDPCPCGSGKKFKKCCLGKATADETDRSGAAISDALTRNDSPIHGLHPHSAPPKHPMGTVALYGPDDKTTTKIVACVFKREGDQPILERWVGANIQNSPKVRRQIQTFFTLHNVTSVAMTEVNMGCPHEEGPDFPVGQDCPFCPFWASKQGSNRRDDEA